MKDKRDEKGFTLIELVVSLTIMSVVVLGVSQMWLVSIRANIKAAQISQASYLAQAKMEHLRSLEDYDDDKLSVTSHPIDFDTLFEKDDSNYDELFDGEYYISEDKGLNGAALKMIRVVVSSRDDEKSKAELVTFKARR